MLQRPDAALEIALDGNDLGAGALILALARKCCQASEQNKWIECRRRLPNFATKKAKHVQCEIHLEQTMPGASRTCSPLSGAAGGKHAGSTAFWMSSFSQITFERCNVRTQWNWEDCSSSPCGPSKSESGRSLFILWLPQVSPGHLLSPSLFLDYRHLVEYVLIYFICSVCPFSRTRFITWTMGSH